MVTVTPLPARHDSGGLLIVTLAKFVEQFNVLQHGTPRQQGGVLEHVAQIVVGQVVRPVGVFQQAGRNLQDCRLPATRWAHDGDELALVNIEADVVERMCSVWKNHGHRVERQKSIRAGSCLLPLTHRQIMPDQRFRRYLAIQSSHDR